FPNVVIPITAGRKASIQLLEEAQKNGDFIGIVSQKNSDLEQPSEKDIYQIGTLAKIIKIIKLPEGNITAFLTQEIFEIKETETQGVFKTSPIPKNISR
ncbi:LON peptidase substrate-binding domain-containing protein, partial [Flavobacterium sp. B17]|uniref:LON peptidase substrate-binding domain-containing protein n=1 Tax=Flavobacterium sp. B17 TaxID=95618 RepID=UPI0005B2604E